MRTNHWSKDETDALILMWNNGLSAREIEQAFRAQGWDREKIEIRNKVRLLRDKGVEIRKTTLKERIHRAAASYAEML